MHLLIKEQTHLKPTELNLVQRSFNVIFNASESSELNLVQWITIRYAKGIILHERYFQRCMFVRAVLMPLAPTFAGTC